jgi:hypothetical protein
MATSGTYTFGSSVTKQQLIKFALIEAGVITDFQSIDGGMWAYMHNRLNLMIKSLKTKGLHLWTLKDVTLLLEKDKTTYTLGGASSDRWSETIVRSVMTTARIATNTSLAAVTTGMTASDVIGVELDTGDMHWTTISSVTDAANLVLAVALPSAVSASNVIYAYTSLAPKVTRIQEAYLISKSSETSNTPIEIVPRSDYQRLSNKQTSSSPVEIYYRPDVLFSELKVWPRSDNNIARIVMSVEYPFDDMTALTDTLSFPDWWHESIYLKLSHLASMGYNATDEKIQQLETASDRAIFDAENFDVETTYIQIEPNVPW